MTQRHEAFYAWCSGADDWHVRVVSWSELYVQITFPGDVIEDGMTAAVDLQHPTTFTSQGTVDSGECYTVLIADTLGTGPFTWFGEGLSDRERNGRPTPN